MRKKLISNTYLRDINKYNLKILFKKECYYAIKEIKEVNEPFVLPTGLCLINNGYYIVEIIPKNENYSIRTFFDNNKKLLQYYIDISLENGLDEETKIPYYDDLYIDITITNGQVEILDEDEIIDALDKKEICQKDYELAFRVKNRLLKEIEEHSNKYLNKDLTKLL